MPLFTNGSFKQGLGLWQLGILFGNKVKQTANQVADIIGHHMTELLSGTESYFAAKTPMEVNNNDKRLWAASFEDEVTQIIENYTEKRMTPHQLKKELEKLQSWIGKDKLSPLIYEDVLTELKSHYQHFPKSIVIAAAVDECLNELDKRLKKQQSITLACFIADMLNELPAVAMGHFEPQAYLDLLKYYKSYVGTQLYIGILTQLKQHLLAHNQENTALPALYYQLIALLDKAITEPEIDINTIASDFLEKKEDTLANLTTYPKILIPLETESIEILSKQKETFSFQRILTRLQKIGQYAIEHPGQAITLGLAAQVIATAATSYKPNEKKDISNTLTVSDLQQALQNAQLDKLGREVSTWLASNPGRNGKERNTENYSLTKSGNTNSSYNYFKKGRSQEKKLSSNKAANIQTIDILPKYVKRSFYPGPGTSDEFFIMFDSYFPAISTLNNGNILIVSAGENELDAQILDISGNALTSLFIIGNDTNNIDIPRYPSVSSQSTDNFIVTWKANTSVNNTSSLIYQQLFNSFGNNITAPYQVDSTISNDIFGGGLEVITFPNDDFLITWNNNDTVYGTKFNSFGQPLGHNFTFNGHAYFSYSTILLSNETTLVSYLSIYQNQTNYFNYSIDAILYDHNLSVITKLSQITTSLSALWGPFVKALTNNNFLIGWSSSVATRNQPYFDIISGNIYTINNFSVSSNFSIGANFGYPENYFPVNVEALPDGNFILAWRGYSPNSESLSYVGQLLTSTGKTIGNQFQIASTLADIWGEATATLKNGNIIAAYSKDNNQGPTSLFARIIRPTLLVTNNNSSRAFIEDQPTWFNDLRMYEPIYNAGASNFILSLSFSSNTVGTFQTIAASSQAQASFDPSTGQWQANGYIAGINDLLAGLQYQPELHFYGNFTVAINASDGIGPDYLDTIYIYGQKVNYPPNVQNVVPTQFVNVGQQYNFTFDVNTFRDIYNNSLSYTASSFDANGNLVALPHWLSFDPATRTFYSITPPNKNDIGGTRIALTAENDSNLNVTTTFDITIFPSLFASNINTNYAYYQDTSFVFSQPISVKTACSNVNVTLTIFDLHAGQLPDQTINNITSHFNPLTAVWNSSGAVADVNNLLSQLTFKPSARYHGNFPIFVLISDGYNYDLSGLISMHGISTNQTTISTQTRNIIIGSAFSAVGLGLAVTAAGIGFFRYRKRQQWAKERENHPFANYLRTHLNLTSIDNFDSPEGVAYVNAIEVLLNEFIRQEIDVRNMYPNELETLAHTTARAIKALIPIEKSIFGCQLNPTDLQENVDRIVERARYLQLVSRHIDNNRETIELVVSEDNPDQSSPRQPLLQK